MTPHQEEAITALKAWYGGNWDMMVRTFRAEKYLPYSQFQSYLSLDGVEGYPALALYKYIFPDAVAITRSRHHG